MGLYCVWVSAASAGCAPRVEQVPCLSPAPVRRGWMLRFGLPYARAGGFARAGQASWPPGVGLFADACPRDAL